MDITTTPSIDIQIKLIGREAEQLAALAHREGMSTTELIQRMIEVLLKVEENEEQAAHIDWQHLGLAHFAEGWDNPEDAVYDDWRTHYGVDTG